MQLPIPIASVVAASKLSLIGQYSQNEEDRILSDIIRKIGLGPKKFVEFGFSANENNTLAFALDHHASGLYIDGSERTCKIAKHCFAVMGKSAYLQVLHAWISRDNIDRLIVDGIGSGEIDVLSIDVDGNDYWLWQA